MIWLLKITLLLLIGISLQRTRLSAALRHGIGVAFFVLLPVALAVEVLSETEHGWWTVRVPAAALELPFGEMLPSARAVVDDSQSASAVSPVPSRLAADSEAGWMKIAWWVWVAVALFLLAKLIVQLIWLRRRLFEATASNSGGQRLLVLPALDGQQRSPFVWGVRRPVIVVPHRWEHWSERRQAYVLAHEQAHIARHDLVLSLGLHFIAILFWYHPLAWWLLKDTKNAAEQACDDDVVLRGADPQDYATALVDVARAIAPQAVPSMAASYLTARVQALMNPHTRRATMSRFKILNACGVALIIALPIFATSFAAQREFKPNELRPEVVAQLEAVRTALSEHRFSDGQTQVEALLQQADLSSAEVAQSYNLLGYVLYLKNDIAGARAAYREVAARTAAIPEPMGQVNRYTLAQLAYTADEPEVAKTHLDQWFENAASPGPAPLFFQARVEMARNDIEGALNAAELGMKKLKEAGSVPQHAELFFERLQYLAGNGSSPVDTRFYFPAVKVAPVYPLAAKQAGIEGSVLVEFTVSSEGLVTDPVIVEASPEGYFEEATLASLAFYRYKPQLEEGQPVAVTGVRNRVNFALP